MASIPQEELTANIAAALANNPDGFEIIGNDAVQLYALEHFTLAHIFPASQGTLSARHDLTLPGNAVVNKYLLKITAARADQASAAAIAQLRAEPGEGTNVHQIIVDFGTVRTVSAAMLTVSSIIQKVEAWNGTEFPLWPSSPPFEDSNTSATTDRPDLRVARFRSDVRTERLRITIVSDEQRGTLLSDLSLILPDSPKDLAISINGGPPVWTLNGPAAKGPDTALSTDAWNTTNQRLVDLTDALQDLTGDPLNAQNQDFDVTLTSREAGVLRIEEHVLEHAMIRRASFNGSDRTSLDFDAEGVTLLPLAADGTPAGARAQTVQFEASGRFTADRRFPAVGPDAKLLDDGTNPLVEMEFTPEKAVILRVELASGIPFVSGLRLPLIAGSEGAELRLVPWSNAGAGRTQPDTPLEDFTGTPVTLNAGQGPDWVSLLFAEPLEIDPTNPPWIAVLLARGSVRIGLSDGEGAQMRVGPPSGPWRPMPGLFAQGGFETLRLPYRVIGDAADTQQPAPLLFEMPGTAMTPVALDPVPGGTTLTLTPDAALSPALHITHFTAGTLDIGTVDIVFDT